MTLIKLESIGRTFYINPVYIESFVDDDDGYCNVYVTGGGETPYKFKISADDLAKILARIGNPNVRLGPGGR